MSMQGTSGCATSIDCKGSTQNEEKSKMEQIKKIQSLIGKSDLETDTVLTAICKFFCINDDYLVERNSQGYCQLIKEIDKELNLYREAVLYNDVSSGTYIKQALTGKYITKNATDWIKPEETVLKQTGTIHLVPSTKGQEEKEDEFSSESMRDEYLEAIKNFGINFAEIIKVLPRVKKNENKEHETEDEIYLSKKPFYSIVTCISCPTFMWESNLKDLSEGARCQLDSIDSDLCKTPPQNPEMKVKYFFDTFGSHIFNGSVHFGGIYVIETVCSVSIPEKAILRKEHTRRKRRFIESLVPLTIDVVKDETYIAEDDDNGCELQQFFKTHYRKIGGPDKINIFHIWKMVVTDTMSVWKMIDTNELSMENFLGIWTIIRNESFQNAEQLSTYLCKIWKETTGFDQEHTDMVKDAQIVVAKDDFVKYIEHEVPQIIEGGKVEEYLSFINKLHRKVQNLQNTTWNKDIWKNQLKENKLIADLFVKICNGHYTDQQDVQIRYQVKSLIDFADVVSFPDDQLLRQWVTERKKIELNFFESHSMRSISEFVSAIDCVSIDLSPYSAKDNEHSDQIVDIEQYITEELNKAVTKLLSILIKKNQWLQYALLITWLVPLGFEIHSERLKERVIYEDFTQLAFIAKEHLKLFNELQRFNKEAWVIRLLVLNILNSPEKKSHKLCDYMDMFCKRANAKFFDEIKTLVSEEGENTFVLCKLLTNMIEEPRFLLQSSVVSWNYFENLQERHENVEHTFGSNKIHESLHIETMPANTPIEIRCLLEYIGLTKYFPEKINLDSVISIQDLYFRNPKDAHELPWCILKYIIAMNFEYREKVLVNFIEETNPKQPSKSSNERHKGLFQLISEPNDKRIDNKTQRCKLLHPIDVCLAIFLCCNPFLKSVVVQKMAACQFAIPLIYKNVLQNNLVFSIWPLREVFTDIENESVASQALRVVAFIRVGECSFKSKSQMINTLLRDQYLNHETFYHKDCALGSNRRTISNGLVEISWFVPSKDENKKTKNHQYSQELSTTSDDQKSTTNDDQKRNINDDQKSTTNDDQKRTTNVDQKSTNNDDQKSTTNDELQYPLSILNLRGSADQHEKETDFLVHMSNVMVIFVDSVNLSDIKCIQFLRKIHLSDTPVVLITNLPEETEKAIQILQSYFQEASIVESKIRVLSTFDVLTESKLNLHEMKKQLIENISTLMQNQVGIKLQDISENLPDGFVSDENCACKESKALADILLTDIKMHKNFSGRRDHFLPLHGSLLWHKWSRKLKQKERTGNKGDYDVNEEIPNQMNAIRKSQIETLNNAPLVISRFVELLLYKMKNDDVLLLFLFWIRQSLDNESRIILPVLTRDLSEKIQINQSLKSSQSAENLEVFENKLSEASFGIEHFFREIGQIYEAFWYYKTNAHCKIKDNTSNVLMQLPKIAAKLLLLGQPLELMDGDAANVPVVWIRDIFIEIKSALGNKKFFIISVLGVQSSGKSTFLNAMFGLQYPVKAGRCTKGLFCQLVPVSNASSLKFDFALVIDTEGLRAPEKAGGKINNDNELATFVIGLGDVILINIKGENLSDMADVLQIVVHALMRLQRANSTLKLQQSVMLVHQNICSVDAKSLTLVGNRKTINHLNEMTKEAANQEHMEHISSFGDMIDFNPLKHVWYVSDLLHGHGAMAPINSAYCHKSLDVLKYMLKDISLSKNRFCSAEQIFMHFESLWKGILAEDFVFSFQNCLEVKAYNLLEAKYQELIWKIEEKKLQWVNENVQRKMEMCKESESLGECEKELNDDFHLRITEYRTVVEIELSGFLEKAEFKDHMINWKEGKFRNIAATVLCLTADVTFQIKSEKDRCSTLLRTNDIVFEKLKEFNKTAKVIAVNLRGQKPDATIIDNNFEDLWINWLNRIAPVTPQEIVEKRQSNIKSIITKCMYGKFDQHTPLLKKEMKEKSLTECLDIQHLEKSITLTEVVGEHINLIGIKRNLRHYIPFMYHKAKYGPEVIRLLDGIFKNIDEDFDLLFKQDTAFDATQFSKVLNYIKKGFERHNDMVDRKFTLTIYLLMKIVAHVSRFSFKRFCAFDEMYKKKFSLRFRLQNYKSSTYKMFKDTIDEKTNEIIVANMLKAELKTLLRKHIAKSVPVEVQRVMRKQFKYQKHVLIKEMLIALADKNDFASYIRYIENTESFVLKWIQETTDALFFLSTDRSSKYTNYVQQNLSKLISTLHESIGDVSKSTNTNIVDWIESFLRYIHEKGLIIPPIRYLDYIDETEYSINNFYEFSTCLMRQLYELEDELRKEFNQHTPAKIKWQGNTPYEDIFEGLWGCRAVCPLCHEPCQKSDINHADSDKDLHTCIQHRPVGISGIHTSDKDILVIESCNYKVKCDGMLRCGKWCNCLQKDLSNFHPYKEYQQFIPKWKILPSSDMSTSKYWTWVMMTFIKQFAEHYDTKEPEIPNSWTGISKEIAIDSLSVYHEF